MVGLSDAKRDHELPVCSACRHAARRCGTVRRLRSCARLQAVLHARRYFTMTVTGARLSERRKRRA